MEGVRSVSSEFYKEKLREYWDLYSVCELFLEIYPEDVFIHSPLPIITIREGCKDVLRIRDEARM